MYQNRYVLEQVGRQYVQERQSEARRASRVRLAELFRRELRRFNR